MLSRRMAKTKDAGESGVLVGKTKKRLKLNDLLCPDVLFQNKWEGTGAH